MKDYVSDSINDAAEDYYRTLLKIRWSGMTLRERKKLKRQDHLLFLAIEGVVKYDRR